jgi:hypothetical protein
MTTVFGLPLALVLLVAGLLVFVASWVVHWLFLVVAVVLIVAALYVAIAGGVLPL